MDWGLLVICGSVWVWGGWESEKMENEERNGWKESEVEVEETE